MTCNEQDFINSLIRQLSSGPCGDSLEDIIPALWELTRHSACFSTSLHFLLTKREGVLFLMGCEAYSVDSLDVHRQMNSVLQAQSSSKTRSQAQSTGNSTRFVTGQGTTRYDEHSASLSKGEMDRHSKSTEVGDGASFYTDDGQGSGFNNSQSSNTIDARDTTIEQNATHAEDHEHGNRDDSNYEYSTTNTNGEATGIPPLAFFSFTGGGSEWRKWSRTTASDTDRAFREALHYRQRNVDDVRSSQGTHDWNNQFQANVVWSDTDYEIKITHDRMDRRQHAESAAQGDGDGLSEEKTEAHNAAQGTSKSETTGSATRTGNRTDIKTRLSLANSQRFKNLQLIYDQLSEQIDHEKKQIKQRVQPHIGFIPCCCSGTCRCQPLLRMLGCHLAGQHI